MGSLQNWSLRTDQICIMQTKICFLFIVFGISQSYQARVHQAPISRQVWVGPPSQPLVEGLEEDYDSLKIVLSPQEVEALNRVKNKRYDRWGYGFGSDGYLYDFVKKRSEKTSCSTFWRVPLSVILCSDPIIELSFYPHPNIESSGPNCISRKELISSKKISILHNVKIQFLCLYDQQDLSPGVLGLPGVDI